MSSSLPDRIAELCARREPFADTAQEICRTLREGIPHYNWVGVYLIEGGALELAAWDGPTATQHTRIPIGEGICGLAAREERTVIADDVRQDPRYLACFLTTRSEIVVPIRSGGRVVGEIDIDSDREAAFNATDRVFLEWIADRLGAVHAKCSVS